MRYQLKVELLKRPRLNMRWRYWRARRGDLVGSYDRLPVLVREHAPGGGFVDVGCMWGVNGAYAFLAEEVGATRVVGLDVFGPTPEFTAERERRGSDVEFVLGDVTNTATLDHVGPVDTVLCAGVLYHHPSPFDVLVALRALCRRTLILRTSTIPEVDGLPGAAVYWPLLDESARQRWNLSSLGLDSQVGITGPFDPAQGYGNWFWGLTPSCLEALVRTAGFEVVRRETEAFAQTLICRPVLTPFSHALPDTANARQMAEDVSRGGRARPH